MLEIVSGFIDHVFTLQSIKSRIETIRLWNDRNGITGFYSTVH